MVEIILLAIFLGAGGYAVSLVWKKIPLLLQVPPQLMAESFVTRPPLFSRSANAAAEFFREGRHRELYYTALVRILHRLRITLLRLERVVYRMLESLHRRRERLAADEERYWSELKTWKHGVRSNGNSHIPDAVLTESAPPELTTADKGRE